MEGQIQKINHHSLIDHFIVTRFCIRDLELFAGGGKFVGGAGDPLKNEYLEKRFMMLKGVAGPSLLSQTNQNFSWIFLVDRNLSDAFRQRLLNLDSGNISIHIADYIEESNMQYLHWLQPLLRPDCKYVVTTNLDDDDALSMNFVETIHDIITKEHQQGTLLPFRFFGCSDAKLWSLIRTKAVPLGWKSDWPFHFPFSSVGMSIMVRKSEMNLASPGINHNVLHRYGDLTATDQSVGPGIELMLRELQEQLQKIGKNLSDLQSETLVQDLNQFGVEVVMTNHNINDAIRRGRRKRSNAIKVLGPETFEGFQMNFDYIVQNISTLKQNNLFYTVSIFQNKLGRMMNKFKRKLRRIVKRYIGI